MSLINLFNRKIAWPQVLVVDENHTRALLFFEAVAKINLAAVCSLLRADMEIGR